MNVRARGPLTIAVVGLGLCSGCHKSKPVSAAPRLASQPRTQKRAAARPQPRPVVPAQSAPRLGRLLSPAEQQSYNTAINQALERARGAVQSASGRQLSKEQQDLVGQVKAFMGQAQEARNTDLIAARGLADKADLVARDLTDSLR